MAVQNLKLASIIIQDLQARAGTNDETIGEYCEAWKEGEKFPPIIVFHDGANFFLADGFHRYFGAKKAGLLDIPADVRKGSRADALWFAVGANRSHGLKRTPEDKRRCVEIALRDWPDRKDHDVAKHIGVTWDLVQSVRLKKPISVIRQEAKSAPVPESRNSIPPPVVQVPERIRGASEASTEPITAQSSRMSGNSHTRTPPPPIVSPPARKECRPKVLDKTGYPVPEKLTALWEELQAVDRPLRDISALRLFFRKWQDDRYIGGVRVNYSSLLAHLDQAYADAKVAKPFAVCTTCNGQVPESCILCKGLGFISEFHWDTCIPAELKEIRLKSKT